jgi:hypothetical protein
VIDFRVSLSFDQPLGRYSDSTATNVDAAFAATQSIAAARTILLAAQLYAEFVRQQFSAGSAQMQSCSRYRSGAALSKVLKGAALCRK